MKKLPLLSLAAAGILSLASVPQAIASTILADTVIDFYNSGAGSMPGVYGGTFPGSFPVTEDLGERGLALPFSGVMTDEQIELVVDGIRKAVG